MTSDYMNYSKMVEDALRGVLRTALLHVVEHGLPGNHHFFISFRTSDDGVTVPDELRQRYPDEMTIVLQHQFWDLQVTPEDFAVTLSFNKVHERMVVPFGSVTAFADPSVQFGLQFRAGDSDARAAAGQSEVAAQNEASAPPEKPAGEVVALDAFRKK